MNAIDTIRATSPVRTSRSAPSGSGRSKGVAALEFYGLRDNLPASQKWNSFGRCCPTSIPRRRSPVRSYGSRSPLAAASTI